MQEDKKQKRPGYIRSLLTHKCSRCRKGEMFKVNNSYNLRRFMKMNDKCPVCHQIFEIEVGFYYGTSYVSYALAVALSAATFIAWWIIIGLSVNDNRFFWWMGSNVVLLIILQPYLMRLSRAIWLSFFVHYKANYETGKSNP